MMPERSNESSRQPLFEFVAPRKLLLVGGSTHIKLSVQRKLLRELRDLGYPTDFVTVADFWDTIQPAQQASIPSKVDAVVVLTNMLSHKHYDRVKQLAKSDEVPLVHSSANWTILGPALRTDNILPTRPLVLETQCHSVVMHMPRPSIVVGEPAQPELVTALEVPPTSNEAELIAEPAPLEPFGEVLVTTAPLAVTDDFVMPVDVVASLQNLQRSMQLAGLVMVTLTLHDDGTAGVDYLRRK